MHSLQEGSNHWCELAIWTAPAEQQSHRYQVSLTPDNVGVLILCFAFWEPGCDTRSEDAAVTLCELSAS